MIWKSMDLWKSFKHKAQIIPQLSLRDWLAIVESWWMLFGFYLALRWVQLDQLEDFTHPVPEKVLVSPDSLEWARHRQKMVSLAARLHLPAMTCLPRALTLRWILSRHAIPSHLRIGMSKTSTGMFAHAWVEVAGENIGEPGDITARFKVLRGDVP
jgi:hypothetical protein